MSIEIRRVFAEKNKGFDIEAKKILSELVNEHLIKGITDLRILHRYDIQGLSEAEYISAVGTIFSEPNTDSVYHESVSLEGVDFCFSVEYLPGQFDQRADSAAQCLTLITGREGNLVSYARTVAIYGRLDEREKQRIKNYFINPVDSREATEDKPGSLERISEKPEKIGNIKGFRELDIAGLEKLRAQSGFAMSLSDLVFCQNHYMSEQRDPTETELRIADTYWSDHCRHTTFLTRITDVRFSEGKLPSVIKETYEKYLTARSDIYGVNGNKPVCLMDIATIGSKQLKRAGLLPDIDESDEINACSIRVRAKTENGTEPWLVMFKNETHNHPTEIEPFGGAATCLGGAIRDPLSGRSYVYQAMRITGSGDPNTPVSETLPGKLPQRTITKGAADGYSSYGNQIGLATGLVKELYHKGYVAKRMEIGAVIGAAPEKNVIREKPAPGDVVILLGGRTGRDGCGGATGSSKEHDERSLATCGAEVQKGNPPTERKLQRLFRRPEVTKLIKKCNDFGAGGVCVAIGELADGLEIYLDRIPKKYEGLNGTELAISESQERMAVVVARKDAEKFRELALSENLEAETVAEVTDSRRMRMYWDGDKIADISRDFLDSNGAPQFSEVLVEDNDISRITEGYNLNNAEEIESMIMRFFSELNMCSQKGLAEKFDSTIGAGTVLMPFGGKYSLTPEQGMAALLPREDGEMHTASLMAFGGNPALLEISPYHGAVYSVVESVTKLAAMGADHRDARLSLQEYFEKLGTEPQRWAKPFSALLGAYLATTALGTAAIGGKDSMSGTFRDMDVPPTLISFAVAVTDKENIHSSEFKSANRSVFLLETPYDSDMIPDFEALRRNLTIVKEMLRTGAAAGARAVTAGGLLEAVVLMCMGNKLGFSFNDISKEKLTRHMYGSIVIEGYSDTAEKYPGLIKIGETNESAQISIAGHDISLEKIMCAWSETLEMIFPTQAKPEYIDIRTLTSKKQSGVKPRTKSPEPLVFIPVFPGTNCEYDTAARFRKAGAKTTIEVFHNLDPKMVKESVLRYAKAISEAQIIAIPGGFSAGDEPEGSGKFIATVFRNEYIMEAVTELLEKRDGLILGICNGFQALIKLGLLPWGRISELMPDSPTLTFNSIGRHVSCLVNTRISSAKSPWLAGTKPGEIYKVPVSHGEGRFVCTAEMLEKLAAEGQIATQYCDGSGRAAYETEYNPNGSYFAIEGITSPDGRVFGKMGHIERTGNGLYINAEGNFDAKIFEAGVEYFK